MYGLDFFVSDVLIFIFCENTLRCVILDGLCLVAMQLSQCSRGKEIEGQLWQYLKFCMTFWADNTVGLRIPLTSRYFSDWEPAEYIAKFLISFVFVHFPCASSSKIGSSLTSAPCGDACYCKKRVTLEEQIQTFSMCLGWRNPHRESWSCGWKRQKQKIVVFSLHRSDCAQPTEDEQKGRILDTCPLSSSLLRARFKGVQVVQESRNPEQARRVKGHGSAHKGTHNSGKSPLLFNRDATLTCLFFRRDVISY